MRVLKQGYTFSSVFSTPCLLLHVHLDVYVGLLFPLLPSTCHHLTNTAKDEWAAGNGVAFDHGKTEATLFHRKRITPIATIKIGANTVPFSKEEAWWLGMWLDSQLTLKDHCATRLREGKKAMARLRRLT